MAKSTETIILSADEEAALTQGAAPARRAVPAKKTAKVSKTTEELNKFTTDGDLVDIWERRMLNPQQKETRPIHITTPGMHLRWINLQNTARYQRARYEQGWQPVLKSELKDEREIYGSSYTTEGFVCRGEKQSEMLMKIPEAVFQKIQKAKRDAVEKSRKHIKENLQGAGAKHFADKYNSNRGDEIAGSMDHFKGDVKFGTEQVSPEGEDLDIATAGLEG